MYCSQMLPTLVQFVIFLAFVNRHYIDTSVVGGVFDQEFELWTNIFFNEVNEQVYKIATSSLLEAELENAPTHVRDFLDQIPESNRIVINYKLHFGKLFLEKNEDQWPSTDCYQ